MTNKPITAEAKALEKFSDKELTQIVSALEEYYPQFNRLKDGWKLIGFQTNKNSTEVPIWAYLWPEKTRYSPAKLRELRKERGVGAKERKAAFRKKQLDNSEISD